MKKVCLQAGHKGMTSGATGAAGERDWTTKITPLIANNLKKAGVEVYETDAFGNNDKKVTGTDWDLFLAIHYDADIYNDTGGFVDFPDKSVDMSHAESKRIAGILSDHYFNTTKIKNVPRRSNANTKFYYMWSSLSAKTPCNIIECGVGWRKPDDFNKLREYDFIAKTISNGILKALNVEIPNDKPCEECEKELQEMRESRDRWKKECKALETELEKANREVKSLNKKLADCQSENQKLQNDILYLNDLNKSLEAKIGALEEELKEFKEENVRLNSELKKCETTVANGLSKVPTKKLILELLKRLKGVK